MPEEPRTYSETEKAEWMRTISQRATIRYGNPELVEVGETLARALEPFPEVEPIRTRVERLVENDLKIGCGCCYAEETDGKANVEMILALIETLLAERE